MFCEINIFIFTHNKHYRIFLKIMIFFNKFKLNLLKNKEI